jgi:hypothetical protein
MCAEAAAWCCSPPLSALAAVILDLLPPLPCGWCTGTPMSAP